MRDEMNFKLKEEKVFEFCLEPQPPNSGVFYVLFEDFLKHFIGTQVSEVKQNFIYKSIKSNPFILDESMNNAN
jgi:hypothetical protein